MSGSGDEMYPESLLSKKEWTRLTLRIQELIPIDLFTVSDRIGSVIFQLPEQIVFCNLSGDEDTTICTIILDERVQAPQRYSLNAYTDFDNPRQCGYSPCDHARE